MTNTEPRPQKIETALQAVLALTEVERELLFELLSQHCPQFCDWSPDNQ